MVSYINFVLKCALVGGSKTLLYIMHICIMQSKESERRDEMQIRCISHICSARNAAVGMSAISGRKSE